MLSLKQQALVQTVAIIGAIFASAILLSYVGRLIPDDAYPYIGTSVVIAILGKLIYDINISRLEYEAKLKQMVDQK